MKKFAIILAAAAMLFASCTPDDSTEVGKWYGYNTPDSKDDVAFVLELNADNSADFIVSAYGQRWQGTYTYDGKIVYLTWNKYYARPNATAYWDAYGESGCLPKNLYEHWTLASESEDASQYGATIEIKFTYSGDTGEIDMFNKPCKAERQDSKLCIADKQK